MRLLALAYAVAATVPLFTVISFPWIFASGLLVTLSVVSLLSAQAPEERSFLAIHLAAKVTTVSMYVHYWIQIDRARLIAVLGGIDGLIGLLLLIGLIRRVFQGSVQGPQVPPQQRGDQKPEHGA